jgi:inhibitor of KinA
VRRKSLDRLRYNSPECPQSLPQNFYPPAITPCSFISNNKFRQWLICDLETRLRPYLDRLDEVTLPEPRQREIPVCYGGEYGPDLAEVCEVHSLSPQQVIDLHSSATYIVYFLGFVPGFAYLGGLPEALVTPRLSAPRRSVPAGSVGIAGHQSGVYPFATPGGWRLIGRTPLVMFHTMFHTMFDKMLSDKLRHHQDALSFLSIGDRVHFTPISPQRFSDLVRMNDSA